MPSATIPCPACSARLILDDTNAGSTVLCPECQETLRLPDTVSPEAAATLAPPPAAPAPEPKVVHRLQRSRTSLDEGTAESEEPEDMQPPQVKRPGQLPTRRRSEEDEARRLAAMGAAGRDVDFDLHRFEKRGMTHFTCPGCHRPHWIKSGDAGTVVVCSGCGQEVVTPEGDAPPRLLHPDQPASPDTRRRTVLPEKRRVEDEPIDQRAGLAPGAGASALRSPQETVGDDGLEHPPILPIPAKGDIRVEPGPLPPPAARTGSNRRPAAPAPPEPEPLKPIPVEEPAEDDSAAVAKGGFRLGSDDRQLHFNPRVDEAVDMEAASGWGGTAEFHPRTRKLLILTLAACALIVASLVTWFLRNRFLEGAQDPPMTTADPMANVEAARTVLGTFFAAKSVDELAAVVRHPDVTRPRMELYYSRNPLKPRRIVGEDTQWNESTVAETDFITGKVTLDNARALDVALEIPADSPLLVDWEYVTNWAEIPWSTFLQSPGDEAVDFRVTAVSDRNYDYFFKDKELDYFCFKLVDPADDLSTWGYCHKDSPAAHTLIESMRRSRQTGMVDEDGEPYAECILRLRFSPEGRKTNQVMIEAFVNDGWIVP